MLRGPSMSSRWIWKLASTLLVLAMISRTNGLAISYCSPDLTNSNFQAVYNQWQTNGACQTTCQGSYAFAVLKGTNCWCSDYIPSDQVSTYDCSTTCPGFPTEWCGNDVKGYYGYYQLDGKAPKGTSGASSSSPSSSSAGSSVSSSPSSAGPPTSASSTSSFGGSSSLTVIASPQTSSGISVVSTGRSSSSATSTVTRSATPAEVYTSVTTVTGQVRTILVTPTPTTDSTLGSGNQVSSSGSDSAGGGGVSTGTVVGIVIGVALGLGLFIGLGVWYCLRKKHRRNLIEAASFDEASNRGNTGIPSRQVSQMSSAGLLGKAPRIQTTGLPSGTNPRSAETLGSNFDRRSVGTDQRLNPYAIYAHEESRNSNVSLQDNQDYSRQLRVANPDP